MEKFTALESKVIPIARNDVDTDMIIPAQYLTSVSREGFGQNLFRRLRDQDPEFPLNLERYHGASILAAGDNFGCGSSREHAVWALLGGGIRAVISSSFADIFASNSAKNGLVLITVEKPLLAEILNQAASGDYQAAVDLERQELTLPGGKVVSFPFDSFRKHCILNGLEDLDYLLANKNRIDEFNKKRADTRFFSSLQINNKN